MPKLMTTQFRLVYLDDATEDLEFTAPTVEQAVRAIANRCLAAKTPVKQVISADGREFKISNPGEQP